MKTLDLVLKYQWYDMIESGEKSEEYRIAKPYWVRRLCKAVEFSFIKDDGPLFEFKHFTHVRFHRGYTTKTMLWTIKEITMGLGKKEWGAPDDVVFIIKLGTKEK